jgi:hypothetical protein
MSEQQREDEGITLDVERHKHDWGEPMFQKQEDPKETEKLEDEKQKEQRGPKG